MRCFETIRRFVLLMAVAAVIAVGGCMDLNVGSTEQDVVSTNLTTYVSGNDVTVNYTNMGGSTTDWIALAYTTDPANVYETWLYTGGGTSGSVTFTAPPLSAGTYEARAYYDWAGTNSFTIRQTSAPFTITGGSTTTVTTDMTTYMTGQTVTLTYSNMPGNQLDWVAVAVAGSPVTSVVAWFYTNGQVNGNQAFTGLPAGNYEARAYRDNKYALIASSTFTIQGMVSNMPTVTTDASAYTVGQTVTVTWAGLPGNPTDWIAISPAGSSDMSYVQWVYTNGLTAGSHQFTGIGAGSYEARAYVNNTYTVLARSAVFTVSTGVTCTPPTTLPALSGLVSGDLVISATQQVNSVAMSPPLGSSILFVSISEDEASPDFGAVMCQLHADDADLGPAGVTCLRNNLGTDTTGSTGAIAIHYTVASFSSGVTVQRGVADTTGTDPADVTLTSVDTTSSFVLLGGNVNGGTGWGNNEFVRAELLDGQTLELQTNVAGTQVSWQVVTMMGASVQRGTASLGSGATDVTAAITSAPAGSMVLASYSTDVSSASASTLMAQATLADATTLDFKRSASGSNLDIAWEVVSLPFNTIRGTATFTVGQSSQSVTAAGIVAASSVAMSSMQSILGQSGGSTTYNGSDGDIVGEGTAALTTGAGTVSIERAATQGSSTIPWTVIDFAHNCAGM